MGTESAAADPAAICRDSAGAPPRLIIVVLATCVACAAAQAQTLPPKIWDIPLGTAIAELPADFVEPACGTNGGPPARALKGFHEFALCPMEAATGLHEVWFRYDDEMEYIARARRSGALIRQYQANALAGQPIITSLLIDGAGRVQGYRVVNDPRAGAATRIDAFNLAELFKGIAWMGIPCTDLPPAEGERPIDDVFIKEVCEGKTAGKVVRVEQRRYYKPGQDAVDPDSRATENQFESSARLEVYRTPR
jgi:hypothetical protein